MLEHYPGLYMFFFLFVSLGAGSILRILCFSIRFTSLHLCCNDTLGSLSQNSTAVFDSALWSVPIQTWVLSPLKFPQMTDNLKEASIFSRIVFKFFPVSKVLKYFNTCYPWSAASDLTMLLVIFQKGE